MNEIGEYIAVREEICDRQTLGDRPIEIGTDFLIQEAKFGVVRQALNLTSGFKIDVYLCISWRAYQHRLKYFCSEETNLWRRGVLVQLGIETTEQVEIEGYLGRYEQKVREYLFPRDDEVIALSPNLSSFLLGLHGKFIQLEVSFLYNPVYMIVNKTMHNKQFNKKAREWQQRLKSIKEFLVFFYDGFISSARKYDGPTGYGFCLKRPKGNNELAAISLKDAHISRVDSDELISLSNDFLGCLQQIRQRGQQDGYEMQVLESQPLLSRDPAGYGSSSNV